MRAKIGALVLCLFLVPIAVLILLFLDARQGKFKFEVARSLLQVGFVAVVGAVVSLAMREYDLEHHRDEYRDELLTSTLARTVVAYNSAKRARR
jgi:hypothetical protein